MLWPEEPRGLTTNLTLLPEQLRRLGYDTRMLGKWHLGFCNLKYTPTRRGFHTFRGFYVGAEVDIFQFLWNIFICFSNIFLNLISNIFLLVIA